MTPPRRVWVTRTRPGAMKTADALTRRGFQPVVEPLLEVQVIDPGPIALDDVTAIAFTSANAIDAFRPVGAVADLPVFVVGEATADAARQAGYRRLIVADGDVRALGRLIGERLAQGVVLHSRAETSARDLNAGPSVHVRPVIAYRTTPLTPVPPACDAVLLQSSRAAHALSDLDWPDRTRVDVICQSAAIARALDRMAGLTPRIAAAPTLEALLDALASSGGPYKEPPPEGLAPPPEPL